MMFGGLLCFIYNLYMTARVGRARTPATANSAELATIA
jgi:hypothetical protein